MGQICRIFFNSGMLKGRSLVLPSGKISLGGETSDLHVWNANTECFELFIEKDEIRISTDHACQSDRKMTGARCEPVQLSTAVRIAGIEFVIWRGDPKVPNVFGFSRRYKLSFFVTIVCLSGVGVFASWLQFGGDHTPSEPAKETSDFMLMNLASDAKLALSRERGRLLIEGYCQDSISRDAILAEIRSRRIPYEDRTLCAEELTERVRAILSLHGMHGASVRTGASQRTVVISGIHEKANNWGAVVTDLASLDGLHGWIIEPGIDGKVKDLIDELRQVGLATKLTVSNRSKLVLVSGKLATAEERRLNEIITSLHSKNENDFQIIYENRSATSGKNEIFHSPVISLGGEVRAPVLLLEDGTRISKHSILENGYEVFHLDRDGIGVERDGSIAYIPFNFQM